MRRATLPAMRALVCTGDPGRPLVLADVPEPIPRSDEAVVSLAATSLNRGECVDVAAEEPGTRLGWDVAGTVVKAAADGSGPPLGARVCGVVRSGGWCERVPVSARALAVVPDGVSFAAASTLPVAGATALRCLELAGPLLGRRVLVIGAAGGVGRYAVQLARRSGAHVTAHVRSQARASGLAQLGAHEVVDRLDPAGPRYDVILESAGGPLLAECLGLLAQGAVLVMLGGSSKEPASFDPRTLLFASHGARIVPYLLFEDQARTGELGATLARLLELVGAGELSPEIALEASWSDPSAAISSLLARDVPGKAVLLVD